MDKEAIRNVAKEYTRIEADFFEVDAARRVARIPLHFTSPAEVFDGNCPSKTPLLNDDFTEWMQAAFELIPARYRVELDISFDDRQGWSDADLRDCFEKNLLLTFKVAYGKTRAKNHLAYGLLGIGAVLFTAMLLINRFWETDSFFKEVFSYVSDIAATVTFWEAMTILLVENHENRRAARAVAKRFSGIRFTDSAPAQN